MLVLAGITGWMTTTPLQAQPVAQLDVHASVGWTHVEHADFASYDNWDHGVSHGAVGLGWYWTDHLKTDVELNVNSRAQFYGYEALPVNGRTAYRGTRYNVGAAALGVTQVVQFFRNAWLHPYLGLGVDLCREAVAQEIEPLQAYDEAARQVVQLEPARRVGPTVSYEPRPFIAAGAKAYVTQRLFMRTDLRVGVGHPARGIVARMGIGIDF